MSCADCRAPLPVVVGRGRRPERCGDCQRVRRVEARRRQRGADVEACPASGTGRLLAAVEVDIAALPGASPVLAELARALARMGDRRMVAPIARELRATLIALYESADDAPDELDRFLDSIRRTGPA